MDIIIRDCFEVRFNGADFQTEIGIIGLTGRKFWWDISSYTVAK